MGIQRTIRAWKDVDFRASLADEGADVTASPVGTVELADADLGGVAGGDMAAPLTQTGICATSWGCAGAITIAISNQISCGTCEESLWHGTCGFSSIGCC